MMRRSSRRFLSTKTLVGTTTLILLVGLSLVLVSMVGLLRNDSAETWSGAQRQPLSEHPHKTGESSSDAGDSGHARSTVKPNTVEIPVLGFTAPMKSMAVGTSEELFPPTATDVYWLEEYGQPNASSANTVYLIGHTSQDGKAVFDPLVNLVDQSTNLLAGDEIVVRTETTTLTYQVTKTQRHHRTHLASIDEVWENQPGRLVVITCFFAPGQDIAPDNMVVFAEQTTSIDSPVTQ